MSHGADVNAKDKIVQTFSAKVSALGTSSVPANLACDACTGKFTATSSAPWLVITPIGEGPVSEGKLSFNVFSNTSSAPRTAVMQIDGVRNKVTVTIEEAGSNAPVLNRQVTYLYQHVLGREPDASEVARWTGQSARALSGLTAELLKTAESGKRPFDVTALYNLILERAPNPSELDRWPSGSPQSAVLDELLGGREFLARFQ
jgi:hypothetical protein